MSGSLFGKSWKALSVAALLLGGSSAMAQEVNVELLASVGASTLGSGRNPTNLTFSRGGLGLGAAVDLASRPFRLGRFEVRVDRTLVPPEVRDDLESRLARFAITPTGPWGLHDAVRIRLATPPVRIPLAPSPIDTLLFWFEGGTGVRRTGARGETVGEVTPQLRVAYAEYWGGGGFRISLRDWTSSGGVVHKRSVAFAVVAATRRRSSCLVLWRLHNGTDASLACDDGRFDGAFDPTDDRAWRGMFQLGLDWGPLRAAWTGGAVGPDPHHHGGARLWNHTFRVEARVCLLNCEPPPREPPPREVGK